MKEFVLCLGYFDSLHIGHRKVIESAKKYADQNGYAVKVATFEDGFLQKIGRKEKEIFLLSEREPLFTRLGVDEIIVFPCDSIFLSQTKDHFCTFLSSLRPKALFVGSDYRFGKNAEGDVEYLRNQLSFPVFDEAIVMSDGEKISTSAIKRYIAGGQIDIANAYLSGAFFISGTVTEGRKKGRELHFPTVNLTVSPLKMLPKEGVYATKTVACGKEYLSVTNVGPHPTFSDLTVNVETHIIDEEIDLYGQKITVYFYKYLRNIVRFLGEEELKEQITQDIKSTKEYFYDQIRSCGQQ